MKEQELKSDSSGDVVIRPATPSDLPTLGLLGASLVRTHHDFDPQRFIAPSPGLPQTYGSFIGKQLERPDVVVFAAEREGAVVGYAYATVDGYDYMSLRGPAGVIQDIVVAPEHRGQGIGRLILDATIAVLAARGVPRIVLSTAEKNETAQRLFAKAGFRRTMIEMTREMDEADYAGWLSR